MAKQTILRAHITPIAAIVRELYMELVKALVYWRGFGAYLSF